MSNKSLLWVVLLMTVSLGGYWVWVGLQGPTQLLGALAVVGVGVVGASWYRRIQAERRWRTIWNTYAERELAGRLSH